MSSLKEIKSRIASVRNTQKITSAMRMMASAKLHRTQSLSENFLRYASELRSVAECLQTAQRSEEGSVKTVAIVCFSSSSGLCGAFNSNIIKATHQRVAEYTAKGTAVMLLPVGKKIADEIRKVPSLTACFDFSTMNERVEKGDAYELACKLIDHLLKLYAENKIQRIELVYHHFKSMGQQVISYKPLPIQKPIAGPLQEDLITEPTPQELADILYPKQLRAELYATLLDASTSEHAARMMAMQTADDNANELLQELTLLYNKTRQQSITNELIDIMGGKIAS
ncbi:MAG: ATP synthase F1 subunit gamma [Bacteroidaceae bacterium]|nr:ATP synthase F1 subunit gamma [Bacteroidaceae bacterium]